MSRDVLYLGSQSRARKRLLEYAHITHKVVEHGSDENVVGPFASFQEHVVAIARSKIRSLFLPSPESVDTPYLFVVTADTLVKNARSGIILGKPRDRAHAVDMLIQEHEGPVEVMTGCCLVKYRRDGSVWVVDQQEEWANGALVEFFVDQASVDEYLETFPFALNCSGAGVVEDHGLSYLKSVHGSYSAVIGLPLYELRMALKKMGFVF